MIKKMGSLKTLEEILLDAKENYPDRFEIAPRKSDYLYPRCKKHKWRVSPKAKKGDLRYPDIVCKKCGDRLDVVMRFHAGVQDHM